MRIKILIVSIIFILAALLRLTDLSHSPPGLLIDEAAFGYNAYLLSQTGHDEWGQKYPLVFRSFGDYKSPLLVYFLMPSVSTLGLNPFSIRMPVAIIGLLSLLAVYAFLRVITKNDWLAIAGFTALAFSPWHINMSRLVHETLLGFLFFVVGLACVFSGKRSATYLFFSALCFVASALSYNSYKYFIPVFVPMLLLFSWKENILSRKYILIFTLCFSVGMAAISSIYIGSTKNSRLQQVNILASSGIAMNINERREFCYLSQYPAVVPLCYLFWNKPASVAVAFIKNYITHLSPEFLFTRGDSTEIYSAPGIGVFFLPYFPFFFLGLFAMITGKSFFHRLLLFLFFTTPIAGAFTGNPQYGRASMMLLPFGSITGYGIYQTCLFFKRSYPRMFLLIIAPIASIFFFAVLVQYSIDYFLIYTKKSMVWNENHQQLFLFANDIADRYDRIYVRVDSRHPYIYWAFYSAYDPHVFLSIPRNPEGEIKDMGKVVFTDLPFDAIVCEWKRHPQTRLAYISQSDVSGGAIIKEVRSSNNVHFLGAIYDVEQSVLMHPETTICSN